jgi:hypothetical protein
MTNECGKGTALISMRICFWKHSLTKPFPRRIKVVLDSRIYTSDIVP